MDKGAPGQHRVERDPYAYRSPPRLAIFELRLPAGKGKTGSDPGRGAQQSAQMTLFPMRGLKKLVRVIGKVLLCQAIVGMNISSS